MGETNYDPLGAFTYAFKSNETKAKYLKKIQNFFGFLGLKGTIDEQTENLLSKVKADQSGSITSKIMEYLQFHKEHGPQGS
jgi:hypothetical protein